MTIWLLLFSAFSAKITSLKHSINKSDKKKKKEVTAQIAQLEQDLAERHKKELKEYQERNGVNNEQSVESVASQTGTLSLNSDDRKDSVTSEDSDHMNLSGLKYEQREISKAQKRRDKKAAKQRERQQKIEQEELENAVNPRSIESNKLKQIFKERKLRLFEIPPDGDCMYRAIEHQFNLRGIETDVSELRAKTATFMMQNKADFLPFLTSSKTGDSMNDQEFEEYCEEIANTKAWGGHGELTAIARIFKVPIEIIQAEGPSVWIEESEKEKTKPLLLR